MGGYFPDSYFPADYFLEDYFPLLVLDLLIAILSKTPWKRTFSICQELRIYYIQKESRVFLCEKLSTDMAVSQE